MKTLNKRTGRTRSVGNFKLERILGRPAIKTDQRALEKFIQGKIVLLTGAGGSVGSELARQIAQYNPKMLIVLGQGETSLFRARNKIKERFPDLNLRSVIVNIRDETKINNLFSCLRPQIVIHAAGYKNIPMLEEWPDEAVKTNIFGTLILAEAAYKNGAEIFVFISTDKAICPTSVMGATKRVGELICCLFNKKGKTKFTAVRLVNVLDSRGNVVEIFTEKIKNRESIIVTHPEMTRYFMTAKETSSLILTTMVISRGGEIFILDPGRPTKIYNLAKELIRLSGPKTGQNIPIIFGCPRPGESLSEKIATPREKPTRHKNIFISSSPGFNDVLLTKKLSALRKETIPFDDKSKIVQSLQELVSDYLPVSQDKN